MQYVCLPVCVCVHKCAYVCRNMQITANSASLKHLTCLSLTHTCNTNMCVCPHHWEKHPPSLLLHFVFPSYRPQTHTHTHTHTHTRPVSCDMHTQGPSLVFSLTRKRWSHQTHSCCHYLQHFFLMMFPRMISALQGNINEAELLDSWLHKHHISLSPDKTGPLCVIKMANLFDHEWTAK